jgi:3-hydroxyisobutyrate dehydrogenase-like beta-hydroxyacid dehydrogenase
MKTRVGFIGLGEMGKWMALNIDHLAEEMLKTYRGRVEGADEGAIWL